MFAAVHSAGGFDETQFGPMRLTKRFANGHTPKKTGKKCRVTGKRHPFAGYRKTQNNSNPLFLLIFQTGTAAAVTVPKPQAWSDMLLAS